MNNNNIWEECIKSEKELLNLNEKQLEIVHQLNQDLWERVKKGRKGFEPVWIREHLARQQFYRQNNLPVEINMIIEEMVTTGAYTKFSQQHNYQTLVNYDKEKKVRLENILRYQGYIKIEQEEEIKEILAKEIKEYQEKWENYLNIKPLPELPKKQSKVKELSNKIKTQFQQVIKPKELPRPVKSSVFNILLIGLLF